MKDSIRKWAVDFVFITAGAALYALGVNVFTSPNDIAPGGVTGISIILSSVLPLSVGTLYSLLNLPIIAAGFFLLSRRSMVKSLVSVLLVTIMTDFVFANIPIYSADGGNGILAAVFGGLLMGAGLGANYVRESTTGGVDIINRIIIKYRPNFRLGQLQLILDGAVALFGWLVWRDMNAVLFALVSIFVQARVVDAMVYGGQECKFLMVFSERSREISSRLLERGCGVTLLNGEGAYTKAQRQVVAAAVRKSDYIKARRIIKETDPRAFVVITGASEVFGEGFQKLE